MILQRRTFLVSLAALLAVPTVAACQRVTAVVAPSRGGVDDFLLVENIFEIPNIFATPEGARVAR